MTTKELIKEIATCCNTTQTEAKERLSEAVDYLRLEANESCYNQIKEDLSCLGLRESNKDKGDIIDAYVNYARAITRKRDNMSGCPCWYGIPNMRFIEHGEWSDSEVYYDGIFYNTHDIEDCYWEWYKEDIPQGEMSDDEYAQNFDTYMRQREDEIKGTCNDLFYSYLENGYYNN